MFSWKQTALVSTALSQSFEFYINWRQWKLLSGQKDQPAASYFAAKHAVGLFRIGVKSLASLAVLKLDLMACVWTWCCKLGASKTSALSAPLVGLGRDLVLSSITYSLVTTVVPWVSSLPLDYYQAKIDEEYGVSASLSSVGMVVWKFLLHVTINVTLLLLQRHNYNIAQVAVALMLCSQVFLQWAFPNVILPLFHTKSSLRVSPSLQQDIQKVTAGLGFEVSDISVINASTQTSHCNAFFIGGPWNNSLVLYDTTLRVLSDEETLAIIVHELAHWHYRDSLALVVVNTAWMCQTVVLYSLFCNHTEFYLCFGFSSLQPLFIGLFMAGKVFQSLQTLLNLVTNYFSRSMECRADKFAKNMNYGPSLAAALTKLSSRRIKSAIPQYWLYALATQTHPTYRERMKTLTRT